MQIVIKYLPPRSAELPDETSGRANLEAWHGQVREARSAMVVVCYVLASILIVIGVLGFIIGHSL